MTVRILLVDDHKIMREGLRSLLENHDEFEVVADTECSTNAIDLASKLKPDIVIMDIVLHGQNGIEATRRIIAKTQGVKVIALSMHADRRYVMEMLKAGASGYLLKERAFEELAAGIREVVAGGTYLSPRISDMVIGEYVHQQLDEKTPVFAILSPREREVLQLIAEGRSTAQIAATLNISTKTVETHRQHIMDKLNIRGIADLTRYAIREGIAHL